MKKLAIIILALVSPLQGCKNEQMKYIWRTDADAIIDSLKLEINARDEKLNDIYKVKSSYEKDIFHLEYKIDSLNNIINSLTEENFVYKYKLGRIKEYSKIVERNPSQSIYFRGWVNRVLTE